LDSYSYHHPEIVNKCLEINKNKKQLRFPSPYILDLNDYERAWQMKHKKESRYLFFNDYEELHKTFSQHYNRSQNGMTSLKKMIVSYFKLMAN
jgi:transposase